jgi:hypothetical protein
VQALLRRLCDVSPAQPYCGVASLVLFPLSLCATETPLIIPVRSLMSELMFAVVIAGAGILMVEVAKVPYTLVGQDGLGVLVAVGAKVLGLSVILCWCAGDHCDLVEG